MSILTNQKTIAYSTTFNWRFEIDINKLKVLKSEKFIKNLQRQVIIYTFIIADVVMLKDKLKSFDLLEDYLYLKNVFDNNLIEILSEQNYNDYIIDLAENEKFLYILLYNLSQKN